MSNDYDAFAMITGITGLPTPTKAQAIAAMTGEAPAFGGVLADITMEFVNWSVGTVPRLRYRGSVMKIQSKSARRQNLEQDAKFKAGRLAYARKAGGNVEAAKRAHEKAQRALAEFLAVSGQSKVCALVQRAVQIDTGVGKRG